MSGPSYASFLSPRVTSKRSDQNPSSGVCHFSTRTVFAPRLDRVNRTFTGPPATAPGSAPRRQERSGGREADAPTVGTARSAARSVAKRVGRAGIRVTALPLRGARLGEVLMAVRVADRVVRLRVGETPARRLAVNDVVRARHDVEVT